jgi:hypothetical protein
MFISDSERDLGLRARLELAYQDETEWPTSLFVVESQFCEHDFVDRSYGGPDSGCVDLACKRCGYNHYVTLY